METTAWISLVSYLPALQDLRLPLNAPLIKDEPGCLLEALALCPRLRALELYTWDEYTTDPANLADEDLFWPFPDATAFAKLHSLTKLTLGFDKGDRFSLADMVSVLVPLTGLAELSVWWPDVVPATLAQLQGLRSLTLETFFRPLVFEAGCLNLPNLLSLRIDRWCSVEGALMLPCVTGLQRLTCIEFSNGLHMPHVDPQLVQLPQLQGLVYSDMSPCRALYEGASPGLFSLPADMGALRGSLLRLQISFLGLPRFPLALTQLVALESLDATDNHFAKLPRGITALSRLTELRLGRFRGHSNPLQLPLDVRALGDLSGFPALRKLTLKDCQAMLCPSLMSAVWHASLAKLCFYTATPGLECAPVVLRLSRELRRLGRGSVIRCVCEKHFDLPWAVRAGIPWAVQVDQWHAACLKFEADMNAYGR